MVPRPVDPSYLGRALLCVLIGWIPPTSGACPTLPDRIDHFLAAHVDQGGVDYGSLWSDPQPIDDLVATLASCPIPGSPEMAIAHWINAYNMLAISGVAHHGPVASVREIPGFFDGAPFLLAGEYLTLDQVEERALEASGMDPRVHFALVCASRGCPPLGDRAWRGDDLHDEFERATIRAMDHLVRTDGSVAIISELFRWYADDFAPEGPRHFIQGQLGPTQIDKWEYEPYDWRLNSLLDLGRTSSGALLPPGAWEIRAFHGDYSQTRYFDESGTSRSAGGESVYRTTTVTAWRGHDAFWNWGLEAVLKEVIDGAGGPSPRRRRGLTRLVPQVKWARPETSAVLRGSISFGLLDRPEGDGSSVPYLDAAGPEIGLDLLWDRWWGSRWTVYLEAGSRLRFPPDEAAAVFRTPVRLFPQYLAHDRVTFYLPLGIDPRWSQDGLGGYSLQLGLGMKYRVTRRLEIEGVASAFPAGKLAGNGRSLDVGMRLRP